MSFKTWILESVIKGIKNLARIEPPNLLKTKNMEGNPREWGVAPFQKERKASTSPV